MAVGIDLGTEDEIDEAMSLVVGVLRSLPVREAVTRSSRYQNWLVGLDAELFARNKAEGASDRDNEKLAGEGRKETKTASKKRAKRGAAAKENPALAEELASGALGFEQVDAIAEASEKTGGDAARSGDLLDQIKSAPPEDAKGIAKGWADKHNNPDDPGSSARRRRQRRLRTVDRFETKDGLAALLIKGDDESIDEMFAGLRAASKRLYKLDGGRDAPTGSRTRSQRLFDAARTSLTQPMVEGSGRGSVVGHVHMWVQLEDFLAGSPNAQFADGRHVPDVVLERYCCNGTIAATVFAAKGEVLHHGRHHRYATPAQVRGLIARDRGCFRCGADVSECEAHHIIPWHAPAKGKTNIDQLVLVCVDCHHFIHDTKQTVFRHGDGRWTLRPATPDEVPPPRRGHHRRKVAETRQSRRTKQQMVQQE